MSYIGGGMYDATRCPLCGNMVWNGVRKKWMSLKNL